MAEQWRPSTLGAVAQVVGGGTPSTKEPSYWGGDIPWLTPTEVVRADGKTIGSSDRSITSLGLARSSANLLPAGTVLLTTRASVGFTAISAVPLATNQGFQSLIPGDGLDPAFLMLWIQANREEFRSRAGGSTFPEVSKVKVRQIPITVPPLEVQRRIVDLVGAVDAHIANLHAGAERAAQLRVQTLLTSLYSSEAHPTPLGACMRLELGRQAVDRAASYRVFGVLNRGQGLVDKGAIQGADTGYTHFNRVRAGQLVMRKLTAWEGPIAVVPAQFDGYFGSIEFPSFTLDTERLLPAFMSHVCTWPGLWSEMKQNVTGSVQRRKRLNPEQLLSVVVPVPPLPEQRLVADELDALVMAEQALRRESAEAAGLRSILLDALLSREVEISEAYERLVHTGVA